MSTFSLHGLLCVDKPKGISSFDVIRDLKRAAKNHGWKWDSIGHGGTLDPFATGLLIIAVGQATKVTQYLLHGPKRYQAKLKLGSRTASGDDTTEVLTRAEVPHGISNQKILEVMTPLLRPATYSQVPPMYSALKKNGKPLYLLAREGREVSREPRSCSLWDFECLDWSPDLQTIEFTVRCSGGTYIRTLGEDLASRLGTVGHLIELRRLESLHFELQNAVPLERCTQIAPSLWPKELSAAWIDLANAVNHLPHRTLTRAQAAKLASGQQDHLAVLLADMKATPVVALYLESDPRTLLGIAHFNPAQSRFELARIFQREIGN